MEYKAILTAILISAIFAFSPAEGASRFARQATPPPTGTNATAIEATLQLLLFLPNQTPTLVQAIQNVTAALQNQTNGLQTAVQAALQNVTTQGTDLTNQLQQFLTYFQSQLNDTGSNATAQLQQSITAAQNYLQSNTAQLQTLVTAFGQNITTAVQNLQGQLTNVTLFLQSGLKNVSMNASALLKQEIQQLNSTLSSGALNSTLTSIITNLQGQTVTFTNLLTQLGTSVNSTLQQDIMDIQNSFTAVVNCFLNIVQCLSGGGSTTGSGNGSTTIG